MLNEYLFASKYSENKVVAKKNMLCIKQYCIQYNTFIYFYTFYTFLYNKLIIIFPI